MLHRMKNIKNRLPVFCILFFLQQLLYAGDIITLTWSDVVGLSKSENLDIKMKQQDFLYQKFNEGKALSDFIPTVIYQFQAVNNFELPVIILEFNGQITTVRMGRKYNFTHIIQLQYPLFTGGMRWANWRIQKNMKKSLAEELKSKEDEVILSALESYFGLILSTRLIDVNQRAYNLAEANLNQVDKFYQAGIASKLDLLRAKSHATSRLAPLISAKNDKRLARENLKLILNMDTQDSLVVMDSLKQMEFMQDYIKLSLDELKDFALKKRSDYKMTEYLKDVTSNKKIIAAAQFLPSINLGLSVQHQALMENSHVSNEDYMRSKSGFISLQYPLFQGGKRIIGYQQARIENKKMEYQIELLKKYILLDVEKSYDDFDVATTNMSSLKQSMEEAKEAFRIADIKYQEGLSTQVDVLGAQSAFTASEVLYQQGIYQYNISQIKLLKAIGMLNSIWDQP
jgi:outer membrane protein